MAKKKPAKKAKKTRRSHRTKSDTFAMDSRKEQAAQLLAEEDFNVDEIAAKIAIARSTLYEWQQHTEFAQRVEQIRAKLGSISLRRVIARRNRRLLALEDRWKRMQQVIDERAMDPKMQTVPGGQTGLLCHDVKAVRSGKTFQVIDLYEVDTGLLREMRETEKQAAQEAGQWTEKRELTGKDGGPIETTDPKAPDWSRLTIEELRILQAMYDRVDNPTVAAEQADGGTTTSREVPV